MAFSSAFIAEASDPKGEALQVKLYVRLNDGTGGAPDTLVTLTTDQSVLSLNPISRRREMQFGVIQGQSWMVRVTNIDQALLSYDFAGCWAAIYGGFPVADEWDIFAQGKINKFIASTDGTVSLEIHDTVMDVLNFVLPRDVNFQSTGWVSGIKNVSKASGSGSYDADQALTLNSPGSADDETFVIEFTGSTAFKIILEDGDETQTGNTSADCDVDNVEGDPNIVTIPSDGWTGTFSSGDQFEFYTAAARTTGTAAELSPVSMVAHLIEVFAGVETYDVLNGAYYTRPLYDIAQWYQLSVDHDNKPISGEWTKGSRLSRPIQDALKLVHGSIFPTRTGQVGIWVPGEESTDPVILNGNPGGDVDILNMSYLDDNALAVNEVVWEYLDPDGNSATYTAVDDDSELLDARTISISTGWRCPGTVAKDAADKYLIRFASPPRVFTAKTTLTGVLVDLAGGVVFRDAQLSILAEFADAMEVVSDLVNNAAVVTAYTDKLSKANYFILNSSLLDGTDVLR